MFFLLRRVPFRLLGDRGRRRISRWKEVRNYGFSLAYSLADQAQTLLLVARLAGLYGFSLAHLFAHLAGIRIYNAYSLACLKRLIARLSLLTS